MALKQAREWFRIWLDALWYGVRYWQDPRDYAPIRCYWCDRWFARDFFWNPWGPT